jgi:RimJ/RimL family protein N-acetyltransferase
MKRDFFLTTERIGFSVWTENDAKLAELLWGEPAVTRYICASGVFGREEIAARLKKEVENGEQYGIQYWPIFELASDELIGCCGLRPRSTNEFEMGFHLRSKYWGRGYAAEAAKAVIDYAFSVLKADGLFAGHNPKNIASARVLAKIGFRYVGDEFYPPTGLYHPSYEMKRDNK